MKLEVRKCDEVLLNPELFKDIWDFLKVRKKYCLAPLIITIVLLGALIVSTQGYVVATFIYSIF